MSQHDKELRGIIRLLGAVLARVLKTQAEPEVGPRLSNYRRISLNSIAKDP